MSLKGSAESFVKLKGELSLPKAIQGKSAYEIALLNGFEGTEAEWLESLTEQTKANAAEVLAEANTAIDRVRTAENTAVEHIESMAENTLNIVQTTGDSETAVMSQKAVTDELTRIKDSVGAVVQYSANNETGGTYVIEYHFVPGRTYLLKDTSETSSVSAASRIEETGADTEIITSWIGAGSEIYFTPTIEAFYLRLYFTTANGSIEIVDINGMSNRFADVENEFNVIKNDYCAPFSASTVAQTNNYYIFPIEAEHTYLFRNVSLNACTMNVWTQDELNGTNIEEVATNLGRDYETTFTATSDAKALKVYATAGGVFEILDAVGTRYRLEHLNHITDAEIKEASSKYEWESGTLSNGLELDASHRCRTVHIPCKKGDIICGGEFTFTVSEYDSNSNFISVSPYVSRYEVLNDGYVRLVSHNAVDSTLTPTDISKISCSIFIARSNGVYGRLSMIEKAMDNQAYYHRVDQKVEELFDKVKADTDSNTLVIAVTTDNHYSPITERGKNQIIYGSVYRKICEELGVDLHLNLGDIADEPENNVTDPSVNRKRIADMARALTKTHIPFAYAIAHHEGKPHIGINSQGESEYTFPTEKTYGLLGRYCRHLSAVHMSENKNSTSYYIDFDMQKIRLVVLDSVSNSQTGYSAKVVNFLSNEALKNIPSGYKVLVASHVPTRASANWDGYSVTNGQQIESALETYAANGGSVLAHIHGHTHWDNIVKETDMSYPLISLCCAGVQKMDVVTHGTAKGVVGVPISYDRNNDDYSAYCMDIFCLHGDTGHINMYRFGVGNDREYAPN